MSESVIRWDQDGDGIVTLTLDDPKSRANTMNDDFRASLSEVVDRLEKEKDTVTGVIVTSAKDTFFAGGDLKALIQVTEENKDEFARGVTRIKSDFRRLEKLGKPTVAALNGAALGGGLEIALACNHRIALDNPKSQFGLPEVTLGLLPGAGGVTRITRLLGIADGLMKVLLQGTRHKPAAALEIGLVDEIAATPDEMLAKAREWIKANPETTQPWDAKGYKMPGGTPTNPKLASMLPAFPGNLKKQLKGAPMPAPHHIMCAAVEGAQVDIDTALAIEGRYFVNLAKGQTAKNMIQAFWFDLNSINGGGSRPDGYEKRLPSKVAVLGAGMMGAGIAYVTARNGMQVVLKDVSIEAAEKGKGYSQKLLDKAVSRGKMDQAKADSVLALITPTADYADLEGCDFVVEAVFEKVSLKHEVFAEVEKVVTGDALLGSNTSTLPITGLADGVQRKQDFIGLHFFSPVDKMPLLEIIRGEQTSDAALASALDQDYPNFQVVFGVQHPADPALAVVERLRRRFPHRDVALVVDGTPHGTNRKIDNLINMLPAARHDVLVISDSDIHAAPDYLRRVVGALHRPNTGLVTTLYGAWAASPSLARRLAAAQVNHAFLPGVLMSRRLGRQDCLGATMALRRSTLDEIGGLSALSPHIADDSALGRLVRATGRDIAIAETLTLTTASDAGLRDLFQHELRWGRTVRSVEPRGYAASCLQLPLFWA
ncbi:bacteriohopanetetrol glucosamine biosynthesis glycosyltransferase HpnI, partial [Jatrophihabitans endophyticus]|uniref:bacteriohopanetetrol glucosamine biosynthesis glycosyltransferase HpnI n=1 Tax=Jatrophihabitans endophyticus TaxID=1206085 RepID=UPI001A010E48